MSQRAAERADEAIARGDLEVGYASIEEAYAALDALYGQRREHDLGVHAQSQEEITRAEAGSELLLLCRVFVHFVFVIMCLPLIATHPRARAVMLVRQAELRSARSRLNAA